MAYVESPIVAGKDFKSVAKDVNGNFDDLKKYIDANIATWEEGSDNNINLTLLVHHQRRASTVVQLKY